MHLGLLMRVLTLPTLLSHKNKLTRIGMEGIKPPYVLLCNHNAFMDFSVALKATRFKRVNFVVAIDGYLKREWLLRFIGCICKRKFTLNDTLYVHPEGRDYSVTKMALATEELYALYNEQT